MCLGVTCHLNFWQNDQGLLHATAITRRWNGHQIRVSTQGWLWRRKFSHHSCWDSNSQSFDQESPTSYPICRVWIYPCCNSMLIMLIFLCLVPFFSRARILGECLTVHSPPALKKKSEWRLAHIPLFWPGSVHSGSVS